MLSLLHKVAGRKCECTKTCELLLNPEEGIAVLAAVDEGACYLFAGTEHLARWKADRRKRAADALARYYTDLELKRPFTKLPGGLSVVSAQRECARPTPPARILSSFA